MQLKTRQVVVKQNTHAHISMAATKLFNPTPFKVSTITATGGVNTSVDLEILFNNITILPEDNTTDAGFTYIEFGKKKSDTIYRGYHKKLSMTRRRKVAAKRFDNQATLVYRRTGTGDSGPVFINIKVFKNGNIQMTGLKTIEHGTEAIDKVIEELRLIHDTCDSRIVENMSNAKNINNQIRLINSDFRLGFEIKRDRLCKIMQNTYDVFCSYEPCIYPGAKIQFFWNSMHGAKQDGVCKCKTCICQGKGTGHGEAECKKITIAVFQSGCIIITGAQTHGQIKDAYDFICTLVENHYDEVKKSSLEPPPEPEL